MAEVGAEAGLNAQTNEAAAARAAQLVADLRAIAAELPNTVLASSLAAEDMVLTDAILRHQIPIGIFSLETGRLHAETLAMVDRIADRYGYQVELVRPDPAAVDAYVRDHGANAFYESVDLRKTCCGIRKVQPLKRALAGRDAWITGQRRAQSVTRADLPAREHDAGHGIEKFNPLADWSEADVWAYIRAHNVPYNPLHDRGYPSIGCDPCTRAIKPGEDVRAGRWWWESSDSKECGLHVHASELSPEVSPITFQPRVAQSS